MKTSHPTIQLIVTASHDPSRGNVNPLVRLVLAFEKVLSRVSDVFVFCNQCAKSNSEAMKSGQTPIKNRSAARLSRAFVTEEANKEPQSQAPAVTPPWQPPPVLVCAFSVHPVCIVLKRVKPFH